MPSDNDYLTMAYAREADPMRKAEMQPRIDAIIAEEIADNQRDAERMRAIASSPQEAKRKLLRAIREVESIRRMTESPDGLFEDFGGREQTNESADHLLLCLQGMARQWGEMY